MKIEVSPIILSFLCLVVLQGLVEAAPLGRQVSDSDMVRCDLDTEQRIVY